MLTFAHIPTGATVNKPIDIDAKSRGVAPATAPTMIGADIETGGANTLRSGSGCLTKGVLRAPKRAIRRFCCTQHRLYRISLRRHPDETQNHPNGPEIRGMSANGGGGRLWDGCRNDMVAWLPTRCKFGFLRVVPVAS